MFLFLFACVLTAGIACGDGEMVHKAGERMMKIVDGIKYAFRWCPAGSFTMGSPEDGSGRSSNEGPLHEVTLTKGFWMLETEVTQAMWAGVMGANVRQRGTEAVNFPPWEGEFEVRQYGHVSDFCRFFTDSRAIKSFPATHTSF